MAAIKQILICCLLMFIFGNKSRFVYGVQCEFCRKDFKVLSKQFWRCKNRLQQNQHTVTEWINVSNNIIEMPNLSIANFKVGLSPSKNILFYFFNESSLKMMKNAFYFILKALFVLKIFKFLSWHLGHVEKTAYIIKKIKLISKFLTSEPGQQTITMYILPNISRSKGKHTLKFGQLIEYNNKNVFLQKLCRKWGRETSSTPLFGFWKSFIWDKSKWSAA